MEKVLTFVKEACLYVGDYLAGTWGSCVAEFCQKIKDLGILFGGYEIKV